jgi:hypothetical protein
VTHFDAELGAAPADTGQADTGQTRERRLLAIGRTRGGSPVVQLCARYGDMQATGTREAAEIARLAEAGRRAWRAHGVAKGMGS